MNDVIPLKLSSPKYEARNRVLLLAWDKVHMVACFSDQNSVNVSGCLPIF